MPSKPILALDASTTTMHVALVAADGACLKERSQRADRHSGHGLALVDECLRARGLRVGDLGALACGAGPGSFTGLRVALALCKGFVLAADLPLVLVSSLDALARDVAMRVTTARLLVPCLDAGKGEVHARFFAWSGGEPMPLGDEQRLTPDALARAVDDAARHHALAPALGGSGFDRHRAALTSALGADAGLADVPGPSGPAIARLAIARLALGEQDNPATAVPSYGRAPDITRPTPRAGRG